MILAHCFLCQRPVLELTGQFSKFDSYLLRADDQALAEGAYGWCHNTCLIASPWGTFWAMRKRERQSLAGGYQQVASYNDLVALRDSRTGETTVVRNNGMIYHLPPGFPSAKADEHGVLFPVDQPEFNLDLSDCCSLMAPIIAGLEQHASYALLDVLAALGISDTVIHPPALAVGRFTNLRGSNRSWSVCAITVRAIYAQWIPADVIALLRR